MHSIETAVLLSTSEELGIQGEFYPFQIGYVSDDSYVLYLVALKDAERSAWIQTLRKGNVKQSIEFVICELESYRQYFRGIISSFFCSVLCLCYILEQKKLLSSRKLERKKVDLLSEKRKIV